MTSSNNSNWFQHRTLENGVTWIDEPGVHDWLRPNIWHVRGRDRDLLFDSGMGVVSLRDGLASLFEKDVFAVASHSHFDHMAGLHEFDHRLCHHSELDILSAPTLENTVGATFMDRDVLDREGFPVIQEPDIWFQTLPWEGYRSEKDYQLKAAPPTRLLSEGDVIDLGDRHFDVLHVPGHSPGSIALFEKETGIFLSGDAIYNPTEGPILDFYEHSDADDYIETMIRISELPVSLVCAGHYAPFGRDTMRAIALEYVERKRVSVCPAKAARRP